MARALHAELIKLRRGPVVWVALAGISLPSIMAALTVVRQGFSSGARVPWRMLLGNSLLISNIVLAAGLYGMLSVYLFAREHSDRTWEFVMTLPVGRGSIVLAKLAVLMGLTALIAAAGVMVGVVIGVFLPQMAPLAVAPVWNYLRTAVITALLASSLMPVIIWLTMVVKSFVVPIGALMGLTVINLFLVVFGAEEVIYFPWALPAILALEAGDAPALNQWSWILAAVVSIVGLVLLWRHVYVADQGGAG